MISTNNNPVTKKQVKQNSLNRFEHPNPINLNLDEQTTFKNESNESRVLSENNLQIVGHKKYYSILDALA